MKSQGGLLGPVRQFQLAAKPLGSLFVDTPQPRNYARLRAISAQDAARDRD